MTLLSSLYEQAEIGIENLADIVQRVNRQWLVATLRKRVMRSCQPVNHLLVSLVSIHQELNDGMAVLNRINGVSFIGVRVLHVQLNFQRIAKLDEVRYRI